jgi:O-antigen/teichoic acid export membrane protein
VLNLVLIPPLGLLGASISTLTAYATSAALLYLLAQRVYPVPYDLRPAAALVVAGGAVLAFGLAADGYTSATPWSPASTGVKAVAFLALAALAFRLLEPGPRHAIVESLAAHTFRRGRSPA